MKQNEAGEWWFTHDGDEYGPYDTKKDANEDRAGLRRFERFKDDPDYIPTDSEMLQRRAKQAEQRELFE